MDRKADAHRKIKLGGLIIKAALESEPTNVLLGLLLEAKEKLQQENSEKIRRHWRIRGDLAFTENQGMKN